MRHAAPLFGPFLATLVGLAIVPAIASAADTSPPVITHAPLTQLARGDNLTVTAKMKDESAIFGATLWYRSPGTLVYSSKEMIRKSEDVWGAQIPTTADVEYYIEAYDEYGNGPSWSGSPKTPFLVKVVEASAITEKQKPPEDTTDKVTPPKDTVANSTKSTPDLDDLSLPTTSGSSSTRSKHDDDDLSEPSRPIANTGAGITPFEPQVVDKEPVYKKWWFIGGASVIGVAAITAAVILLQPQPVERNVFGTGLQTQ